MNRYHPERIRRMRRDIRAQIVEAILDDFDGALMELPSEDRAVKYAKMRESAFRFFRGSAYLFYFDVAHIPFPYHTPMDKPTWIQGDLHFENFGAFQSRDGRIVYDINDFDEGYLGSYLYDLLRMSVSVALVCESLGYDDELTAEAIESYLKAYYKQIRRFSERKDDMVAMRFASDNTAGPIRKLLRKLEKKRRSEFLDEVTERTESAIRRFVQSSELAPAEPEERSRLHAAWDGYVATLDPSAKREAAFYAVKDVAVKHGSGTASLGLDRYYVLIEGHRDPAAGDDIILEVKEVRAPVPAYFVPYHERFWALYEHHGQRVAATQRAMQHEADPFLGWLTIDDRHFYVRERSPFKKRLKADKIGAHDDLITTLKQMGRITAKIHSRADNDLREGEGIIDYHAEHEIWAAMGSDPNAFAATIAAWSIGYRSQVHEDYDIFKELSARRYPEVVQTEAPPL
ncbi:DUF2252 domain-containing protein [Paenibacillus sp.]|uniref:DUF2252 domain-containing protein n=1 Tax=Paenibacillus sp. TaxID=58172 RepID=UPI002D2A190A|nr:DUF2252 family protein [Paenibacillus sp.]HZG87636.1 DUF2252 family protein [Paenibacillus sp.]